MPSVSKLVFAHSAAIFSTTCDLVQFENRKVAEKFPMLKTFSDCPTFKKLGWRWSVLNSLASKLPNSAETQDFKSAVFSTSKAFFEIFRYLKDELENGPSQNRTEDEGKGVAEMEVLRNLLNSPDETLPQPRPEHSLLTQMIIHNSNPLTASNININGLDAAGYDGLDAAGYERVAIPLFDSVLKINYADRLERAILENAAMRIPNNVESNLDIQLLDAQLECITAGLNDVEELRGALDLLDQVAPNYASQLYGFVYDEHVKQGFPQIERDHADYGRVGLRNEDGFAAPQEVKRAALLRLSQKIHADRAVVVARGKLTHEQRIISCIGSAIQKDKIEELRVGLDLLEQVNPKLANQLYGFVYQEHVSQGLPQGERNHGDFGRVGLRNEDGFAAPKEVKERALHQLMQLVYEND